MFTAFLVFVGVVILLFLAALASGAAGGSRMRRRVPKLVPLRRRDRRGVLRRREFPPEETEKPYVFARNGSKRGTFVDATFDGDEAVLRSRDLPVVRTPAEIADWLGIRVGQLAWLVHFGEPGQRPPTERKAHYVFRWQPKRSGGHRLIESPKPLTKRAQFRIHDDILSRIAPHPAAHGFVPGRSIVTNAKPHVGRRVLLKMDLENFYAGVRFNRVVAILRSLGYCREAATWLGRLCTSAIPSNLPSPEGSNELSLEPYRGRHLPQGAPTSPALANLSAFSLDVRLAGLARSFGATYTRYADDLTFSGDEGFLRALRTFIPLAKQVVRQERFRVNAPKQKVIRNNQRQVVTGVVVNAKPNVSRADYDRLKATLFNCTRHGPSTQNPAGHPDFAAHLRGRIAHVAQLNPDRGRKLLELFGRIDWSR